MSDEVLAPVLTILLLAGLFAWVPVTGFCNARCRRLLEKRTMGRKSVAVESQTRPELARR